MGPALPVDRCRGLAARAPSPAARPPRRAGAACVLRSASPSLIVSLGLFGFCGKVFANPLITEVIVASRNEMKGA